MSDRGGAPAVDADCADAVDAALRRVLGLDPGAPVRADTPLRLLGADSLALLCLGDVLAESGWQLDEARARQADTVADLATSCVRAS